MNKFLEVVSEDGQENCQATDNYLAAIQRGLNNPNIDPTASVLRKLRQALHSCKRCV